MPTISFAGLTFTGDMSTDGFAVARLMGWYDGASSRADMRPRPLSDGSFGVSRFYRGARVISLEGDWVGASMAEAYAARETLAAVQADGLPSTFSVTDELGVRSSVVVVDKSPIVDDVLTAPFFKWSFDVVAPDPRKYGPEQAPFTGLPTAGTGYVWPAVWPADWGSGGNPGRVTATNTGTSATEPVLEVLGGLAGGVELVEITSGSYLRLERDIPSSSTVFFDTRTGRAYLDSSANDISSFLTRRDWGGFTIPAAGSRVVQFNGLGAVSGTPRLTVRFSPAY